MRSKVFGSIAICLLLFGLSQGCQAFQIPIAAVHTVVGAVAGSTGAVAAYPIDYVKSQLQTEEGRSRYNGGFDAALEIVKAGGPLALYRGVLVNVIGVAPEKTIKLTVNSCIRAAFVTNLGFLPLAGELIAGGAAGMMQVIVTNPLEVVKVKIQTSDRSIHDVLGTFVKRPIDLYEGVDACLVRDILFSAILFPIYAHGRDALIPSSSDGTIFWAGLLAGSLAAAPAAFLSTPADVVKTRMQQSRSAAEAHSDGLLNEDGKDTFLGVLNRLASTEGPEVLVSGWLERVFRSVPQFGVTLAVYDVLIDFATKHGWLLE